MALFDAAFARRVPGGAPWVIAALLLAALLVVTVLLHRTFLSLEESEIERHFESIGGHLESDLLQSSELHETIQRRMAMRLAYDGPFDEAAWRSDAEGLIDDYPYYRYLAVLEGDFRVRWFSGSRSARIDPGDRLPIRSEVVRELASGTPVMATRVVELVRLDDGGVGLLFVTPVVVAGETVNWLVAMLDLREALAAMLTGLYMRDLVLTGEFAGREITLPDDAPAVSERYRTPLEFVLADASRVRMSAAMRAATVEGMRSGLPQAVLIAGISLSMVIVIAALLAMAAARQARVLADANRALENEVRDRRLAERELGFLLIHDSLTGLPNRQGITRALEAALAARAEHHVLGALFIDLDQFKDINETLGHHLGDQLLSLVPERLQAEIGDGDAIGRLGGDEFLIVTEQRDHGRIIKLADRLLAAFDQPFKINEHQLFVTASIGIACARNGDTSPADLIRNADAAVFRAKQLGRNQHAEFTPEMFARVEYRLNLSRDLRQALDREEFRVAYQPIVRLDTLELIGVEALLRWPHPDGYNVPPRDFIRVAEETGFVHRLSKFALSVAIGDLAGWQREFGDRAPWLAVNISGAQFREHEFVRDLSMLLHHHRVLPERVHLEITEEVLIENLARNREILEQLVEIGMPIAVDDFGIGYSSLAYVKNFPISTIKIDQGFIRNLERDSEDQVITRTICNLSRELNLATVAEGIEQPGQMRLLKEFGCQMGQGFLFQQPAPAADIVDILTRGAPWPKRLRTPEPGEPQVREPRS